MDIPAGSNSTNILKDRSKPADQKDDYLWSKLFKITLADPEDADDCGDSVDPASSDGPQPLPEFYVHEALLASLSPELQKHTQNEMKEGLNGEMVLHDVDLPTMKRFLQWMYRGRYDAPTDAKQSLIPHIKLYILGDRFNIRRLQSATFGSIILAESDLRYLRVKFSLVYQANLHREECAAFLNAVRFAAANLPVSDSMLLPHLVMTLAWAVQSLSGLQEFTTFIQDCPEIAVKMYGHMTLPLGPPWSFECERCGDGFTTVPEKDFHMSESCGGYRF